MPPRLPDNDKGRICRKCGKFKPFSEFHKNKSVRFGVTTRCKSCCREDHNDSYQRNKPQRRAERLMSKFNLTVEEYDEKFAEQNGVCAICGKPETRNNKYGIKRLAVDHDHKTRKVRGLLCSCCNQALGQFYVDEKGIELLLKAIEYTRRYSG